MASFFYFSVLANVIMGTILSLPSAMSHVGKLPDVSDPVRIANKSKNAKNAKSYFSSIVAIRINDRQWEQCMQKITALMVGMFIRRNMTDSEVNSLIGASTQRVISGGFIGRTSIQQWYIPQYEIRIIFFTDANNVFRVDQVIYP